MHRIMNQSPTHLFLSLLVLIGLLIVPAHAQSQDPEAIMNASASAIKEVAGFNAQFQMKGQGAAMFADTLPSMTGQLFFGTHDELGRVIHCIGEAKDQQKAPSQAIDILITKDRYLWTDHSKQTINEHPRNRSSRGLPAAFNLVLVQSLINDDPYANDTDGALSMSVLTQETIAGTLCDVVEINRFKSGSTKRRSPSDSYTDVRWYIGAKTNSLARSSRSRMPGWSKSHCSSSSAPSIWLSHHRAISISLAQTATSLSQQCPNQSKSSQTSNARATQPRRISPRQQSQQPHQARLGHNQSNPKPRVSAEHQPIPFRPTTAQPSTTPRRTTGSRCSTSGAHGVSRAKANHHLFHRSPATLRAKMLMSSGSRSARLTQSKRPQTLPRLAMPTASRSMQIH